MKNLFTYITIAALSLTTFSCGDDDSSALIYENQKEEENQDQDEEENQDPEDEENQDEENQDEEEEEIIPDGALIVSLSQEHQTMVGFGGALCWLTHFLYDNPKTQEIQDLYFKDLGMDLLRVGMWYYPKDYPENTDATWDDDDHYLLENTIKIVETARKENPDLEVLLSCWGPPAALKSNGQREGGMLKYGENSEYDKNDKERIKAERSVAYSNYAQFFEDAFNHIGFIPDYLSIQNECSYKADWVSCKWSYNDTHTEPNYYSAFDSVYNRLSPIYGDQMPKMLACEAENLDVLEKFYPWKKITGDKFNTCWGYNYHNYNFNSESDINDIKNRMITLGQEMTDRPNMMTEYDGMVWFKTARMMQYELIYANCSAYLYWNLFWYQHFTSEGDQIAAIAYTNDNTDYNIGPFYYLIKHFSKHINRGYKRVDIVDDKDMGLENSAFVSPDGNNVTIIVINPTDNVVNYNVSVENKEIETIEAYQSLDSDKKNCYKTLNKLSPEKAIKLPQNSITTIALTVK